MGSQGEQEESKSLVPLEHDKSLQQHSLESPLCVWYCSSTEISMLSPKLRIIQEEENQIHKQL